jgi:transcriptional regulator with PAS, ATPase and Fis domain
MTATKRLLIAGNDPSSMQSVQAALRRFIERGNALTCRLDGVREFLKPSVDGVVLLLASQPADLSPVRALLQEIQLLRWNPRLVLVESASANINGGLNGLASALTARITWPTAERELAGLIRAHAGHGTGFRDPEHETISERIARNLLLQTPSLNHLVEPLSLAAAHDVTVLLDGETGTGKTFLARLIHDCSPRAAHRFLVVPCGALAPNLIESELFGHVKGAFTGADSHKVGKFAAVGSGTILLDEIDALSLEHQANLLRVIETGEFEPVGSNETQVCTARVIVATNRHLEEAVERGDFRRDLYYRLNVMPFYLPPLRERILDIEPLVRGLAARFALKFNKELLGVHAETLEILRRFPWPGNLRELENVVQQAVLFSTGPELTPQHLPAPVRGHAASKGTAKPAGSILEQNRNASERGLILRALENSGYCVSRAARALGVSRVTLYKKMKKHDLMERRHS